MPGYIDGWSLENLAKRFERFGREECAGHNLVYEPISLGVANDPAVLEIAATTPQGQPAPNLLYAVVHYLLMKGIEHPLSAFYRTFSLNPRPREEAYPCFHDFCLEHRAEIQQLLASRRVQTNEVRRCACLLPFFGMAYAQGQQKPLALVEVGASAGLNLLWDNYGYDYGEYGRYGVLNSPLQLNCEIQGEPRLPLPAKLPEIAYRVGLDLSPVNLRDPDAVLWLEALVWPEHLDRMALLRTAAQLAQPHPPELIEGDALEVLPQILPSIPPDTTLCLYHSFTVNQFSPGMRERFTAIIDAEGQKRDLFRFAMEYIPGGASMTVTSYQAGQKTEQIMASCNGHGRWLKWLANPG